MPHMCTMPGCDRLHKGRGMCPGHMARWKKGKRGKELEAPLRPSLPEICEINGCNNPPLSRGMCEAHYSRWNDGKRGEELEKPIRERRHPTGQERVSQDGYVFVKVPNGEWKRKHHIVMEQHLGRSLLSKEEVHHRNGIRDDNCIENLELWTTSQPYGQRVTDKIEWGVKFLADHNALPESTLKRIHRKSRQVIAFLSEYPSVSLDGRESNTGSPESTSVDREPRHKPAALYCSIPECGRPTHARNLCIHHNARWLKGERGELLAESRRPKSSATYTDVVCHIEGCNKLAKSRQMCPMHYERWRKGKRGEELDVPSIHEWTLQVCSLEGCEKPARPGKMCKMHNSRWQRGKRGEELMALPTRQWQPAVCKVQGCEKEPQSKMMCVAHYRRWREGERDEELSRPMRSRSYLIGTKYVDEDGYVYIKVVEGDRWKREHRHIVEQHLGRPLGPKEEVHHMNADKTDNRLENLELWSHSQPPGGRVRDKLNWVADFLIEYGIMTEAVRGKIRLPKKLDMDG